MSLAPATLVRLEDLSAFQERLYAANGTSIRVVGEAVLHRRVGDMELEAPCPVTSQIAELIIGLDWLEKHRVQWKFGDCSHDLGHQTVPIYD